MDEEILIDKDDDIKYLERLVSQNTFLMILIVIVAIFPLSFICFSAYIDMNNSNTDNYTGVLPQMSSLEIEAFNSQFINYEGRQTGNKLKALIGTLIANANTYEDDSEKCPTVAVMNDNNEITYLAYYVSLNNSNIAYEELQKIYIDNLAIIRNELQNNNYYSVEFEYTERGLINSIIITGTINSLNEGK